MTAWLVITRPSGPGGTEEHRFSAGLEAPWAVSAAERISALPTVSVQTLPGGPGRGGSNAPASALRLNNRAGALDALVDLDWEDAEIEIYSGPAGARSLAEMALTYKLRSEAISESAEQVIEVTLKDRSSGLDVPLKLDRYAGTGGAEGPVELSGEIKPVALGRQIAVDPVMIDRAALIFQLHHRAISGVRQIADDPSSAGVTDQGVRLSPDADYPDFAALKAATVPAGTFATCLAEGLIRLGREPVGLVTVDFDGDAAGGYVERPGAVIRRILTDYWSGTGITVDAAALDALDAAFPHPVKLFTDREGPRVSDWIETAASAAGAMWWVDALGMLKATLFDFSPAAELIAEHRRTRPDRQTAVARTNPVVINYRRITRVHAAGELAQAQAADLVGTIDFKDQVAGAEKPADGADVTAPKAGARKNASNFTTQQNFSGFVHGFNKDGLPADINAKFNIDDGLAELERHQFGAGGATFKTGDSADGAIAVFHLVWATNSDAPFSFEGTSVNVVVASFIPGFGWFYSGDQNGFNGGAVAFEARADMVAIGTVRVAATGGSETPGITNISIRESPLPLDHAERVESNAIWDNIGGPGKPEDGADVTKNRLSKAVNLGFELGTFEGWSGVHGTATLVNDPSTARSGDYYLRLPAGTSGPNVISETMPTPKEGERIKVFGSIQRDEADLPANPGKINVRFFNSTDALISQMSVMTADAGTAGWQDGSGVVSVPANAVKWALDCGEVLGSGAWFYDDLDFAIIPKDSDIDSLKTTNAPAEANAAADVPNVAAPISPLIRGTIESSGDVFQINSPRFPLDEAGLAPGDKFTCSVETWVDGTAEGGVRPRFWDAATGGTFRGEGDNRVVDEGNSAPDFARVYLQGEVPAGATHVDIGAERRPNNAGEILHARKPTLHSGHVRPRWSRPITRIAADVPFATLPGGETVEDIVGSGPGQGADLIGLPTAPTAGGLGDAGRRALAIITPAGRLIAAAEVDQAGAAPRRARIGVESGSIRDGDTVTFAAPYFSAPQISFFGGQAKDGFSPRYIAELLSVTGFRGSLKRVSASTGTMQMETTDVSQPGTGPDWQANIDSDASPDDGAFRFVLQGDAASPADTNGDGFPEQFAFVLIEFFIDLGGGFVSKGQQSFTFSLGGTQEFSSSVSEKTVTAHGGNEFGAMIVDGQGVTNIALVRVEWSEPATTVTEEDAAPDGTPKIAWLAEIAQ